MGSEMSKLDEERLERIIDDLLWAVDHVASRWDRTAEDARLILQSARAHNEWWHNQRSIPGGGSRLPQPSSG